MFYRFHALLIGALLIPSYLLGNPVDVDDMPQYNQEATQRLISAIQTGARKRVIRKAINQGADPNIIVEGFSLLMLAVAAQRVDILKLLLDIEGINLFHKAKALRDGKVCLYNAAWIANDMRLQAGMGRDARFRECARLISGRILALRGESDYAKLRYEEEFETE